MQLTKEDLENKISESYELPNKVLEALPEPLVTVRTSTYQHGPYIKDCIEGVLMQKTTFPVEYIIGEDYSTDGTRQIVFEYAKKYPEIIRVITAEYNVGMKANGFRCSLRSRGKYLALCEGDDYWTDPYKLQTQIDQMELNPECDLSFHPVIKKYADDSLPDKIMAKHYGHDCIIQAKEIIMGEAPYCPTASVVIRRQSIINDAYKNANLSGSFFVKIFSSLRGGAIYIDKPMAVYRKMSVGSWSERERNIPEFFIAHHIKFIEMLRRANIATGNKFNREFDFLIQKRYDTILGSDKAPIQLRRNIYENHRNEIDFGTRLRWNALYQSKFRAKLYKLIRHIICG